MQSKDTNSQPPHDAAALLARIAQLTQERDAVVDEAAPLHLELALLRTERDAALAALASRDQEISVLDQACAVAEDAWQREKALSTLHEREAIRLQLALADREPVSVSDDEERVLVPAGVLALLLEQAAQTETLRAKYQRQQALLQDKRIKPGEKVVAAAVWDLAGPVGRDPGPAAPQQIYRAALAQRTGMGDSTISRKLSDLAAMGVIGLAHRQTAPDHTEIWATVGQLPDGALSAAEVDALAATRRQDRTRVRRCPHCGGTHLKPTHYACTDCATSCTEDQAVAAGERIVVLATGALVDGETGEVLTPAPPDSAHLSNATTGRADDDVARSMGQAGTTSPESVHLESNVLRCTDSGGTPQQPGPQWDGALPVRVQPLQERLL